MFSVELLALRLTVLLGLFLSFNGTLFEFGILSISIDLSILVLFLLSIPTIIGSLKNLKNSSLIPPI